MKIAAYVMDAYAKQTYASESHDVRAWPGFEMVLHAIGCAGFVYEYAGRATVHKYDVVLVSITSDCDWWPFLAERATWKAGNYVVIAGGAGVLNVRPFLQWIDAFVLGRGEKILPAMLHALHGGGRYQSPSVVWSTEFDATKRYDIAQAESLYPHTFALTNGKPYRETGVGCPNKCLFCGYTWHRKYIGDGTFAAGADSMNKGNRERTIIDLLAIEPEKWQEDAPLRIVGLDGMSERLRIKANKRITRDMLRAFFAGLARISPPHQVKLYCIVGYPGETQDDWMEFCEDLRQVDAGLPSGKQWSLLVHFTPFRAMPATPAACWEMSQRNYRGVIAKAIKQRPGMPGNVFYQGNRFWAVEGMGTDSLPSVIQSAICLRGTEADAENVMRVARAARYWAAPSRDKEATLTKLFDVPSMFARHTWETVPTKYLRLRNYKEA
jgi:hypothetical protein